MTGGLGGADGGSPDDRWRVGPGPVWTAGVGALLLAVGVLGGRADVALVGGTAVLTVVPALVGARGQVTAAVEQPEGGDGPGAQDPGMQDPGMQGRGALGAGGGATEGRVPGGLASALRLTAPPAAEVVRVRVERAGHRPSEALVTVPGSRTVHARAASVRTGRVRLFDVQAQGLGGGGHLTGPVTRVAGRDVVVLPRGRDVRTLPLPPRLRGSTGQHRSRRPGEGGDLRDVHPRTAGEALRRVDWRVTARRSPGLEELFVRRTFALAEATVTLVVDSRDELGPDPATWSGRRPVRPDDATSLDLARHAAASVAEGHVVVGDRVGLEDLGVRRRTLRVGTGRRQLDRLAHQLALLRPEGRPADRVRAPQLASGSLVYLFSTFLDDEPVELARTWQATGHRVVAVDVLPTPRAAADHRLQLALRMVQIDRSDRLAQVRAAGIDLVRWADPDAVVELHRIARASERHRTGTGARRGSAGASAGGSA